MGRGAPVDNDDVVPPRPGPPGHRGLRGLDPDVDDPARALPRLRGPRADDPRPRARDGPRRGAGTLLATFNSGFYEADSAAGFYTHGTLYFPMVNGLATVVAYTDGTVDIVDWQGGPTPGPTSLMARQNLPLLVDTHAAAPRHRRGGTDWGVTLGGVPAVWRTGARHRRPGQPDLRGRPVPDGGQPGPDHWSSWARCGRCSSTSTRSGRSSSPTADPGAAAPALFVPNPNQIPNRFLYPSTKDFFAVFERRPVAAAASRGSRNPVPRRPATATRQRRRSAGAGSSGAGSSPSRSGAVPRGRDRRVGSPSRPGGGARPERPAPTVHAGAPAATTTTRPSRPSPSRRSATPTSATRRVCRRTRPPTCNRSSPPSPRPSCFGNLEGTLTNATARSARRRRRTASPFATPRRTPRSSGQRASPS